MHDCILDLPIFPHQHQTPDQQVTIILQGRHWHSGACHLIVAPWVFLKNCIFQSVNFPK